MIPYLLMIDAPEEQSKFEQLYLKYRCLMYNIAFDILQNKQDAEDAVHQAFLRIAENIETIDITIGPRVKGLVVTIVEHCAIDAYRKKKNHPTVELEECLGMTIEYDGCNAVTACMAKLPAVYREVLLLKNHYGYSAREIAKILGITEANVHKTHQRAKEKLRIFCIEEGLL